MNLHFRTRYDNHDILAMVNRPFTTKFSISLDGERLVESSRPVTTDMISGIKTWFGLKPVWAISAVVEVDGKKRQITARHYTTFTRQYVVLLVDGQLIGPEERTAEK